MLSAALLAATLAFAVFRLLYQDHSDNESVYGNSVETLWVVAVKKYSGIPPPQPIYRNILKEATVSVTEEYEYTTGFYELPDNERFAFFQMNRPGPPRPIVIFDGYPDVMNEDEEAIISMAEQKYLDQGVNVIILNSFHVEGDSGEVVLDNPYNDKFLHILEYIHREVSRFTPIAIQARSFHAARALEYVTDYFHKYNVVAIYSENPVLGGYTFLFKDRNLSWRDIGALVMYGAMDFVSRTHKYRVMVDGVAIRARLVWTDVIFGYSNRFLNNVNPEAFVRVVNTKVGGEQKGHYDYWLSGDKNYENSKSFAIDEEESNNEEIMALFKRKMKDYIAKRKEKEGRQGVQLPEISGANDLRRLGLDKLDFGPERKGKLSGWF